MSLNQELEIFSRNQLGKLRQLVYFLAALQSLILLLLGCFTFLFPPWVSGEQPIYRYGIWKDTLSQIYLGLKWEERGGETVLLWKLASQKLKPHVRLLSLKTVKSWLFGKFGIKLLLFLCVLDNNTLDWKLNCICDRMFLLEIYKLLEECLLSKK